MRMEEFAATCAESIANIRAVTTAITERICDINSRVEEREKIASAILVRIETLEATVEKQDRQIELLYTRVGRMDKGV